MTITPHTISRLFARGGAQVKRHVYALLFLFFVGAMLGAGFIFWRYGYQASLEEPAVTVYTVTAKESDLRALIEKMKERDASRDAILRKTVQDSFIKPEAARP